MPELKTGSFIHDDIQPQNLLAAGRELTGIIDFDLAFWGDPYFELPYCENIGSYLVEKRYEKNINKRFYKGYNQIKKIDIKKYNYIRDYYNMCRQVRMFGGFEGLRRALPKKIGENIKRRVIINVEGILKRRNENTTFINQKNI